MSQVKPVFSQRQHFVLLAVINKDPTLVLVVIMSIYFVGMVGLPEILYLVSCMNYG